MTLESSAPPPTTPKNSSPNLSPKQPLNNNKLIRHSSSTNMIQRRTQNTNNQRRSNLATNNNDLLSQHSLVAFSVPLLTGALNDFFQATKIMEDEIMLPTRLKDMPLDENGLDNSVQPTNWHELYTFVREMRNQLTLSRPFREQEDSTNRQQPNELNDDEGIVYSNYDSKQYSSSSSNASSDELEQSTASSTATSCDTIKDELQYHFFGLLSSLDNLKNLADRVTEKYREDSTFNS